MKQLYSTCGKTSYNNCATAIAPQSKGICLLIYKQNQKFGTILCRVKIEENNQNGKMIGFTDFSFWTKYYKNCHSAVVFTIYYERWGNLPPLGDDRNMRQDNYYPVFVWDEVIYWRAWVINGIIDLPGAFVCPYDAVGWTLKINCCSYHTPQSTVIKI